MHILPIVLIPLLHIAWREVSANQESRAEWAPKTVYASLYKIENNERQIEGNRTQNNHMSEQEFSVVQHKTQFLNNMASVPLRL